MKSEQLEEILNCFERKICPLCEGKLTKQTQSHDPAFRRVGYGRLSHSYDLWVCEKGHGMVFCDDSVLGLSYSPGRCYICPICSELLYPKLSPLSSREDEDMIELHLTGHTLEEVMGIVIQSVLVRNYHDHIELTRVKKETET